MDTDDAKKCECHLCEVYKSTYDLIQADRPRWLTVSPPSDDGDPSNYRDGWIDSFIQMLKCTANLILIVEFAQCRMHFHMCYTVTDRIKEYRLINGFRKTAQVKVYNGAPQKGLHYLFKDIEDAEQLLDKCIYIREDLILIKTLKSLKLKELRKKRVIPDKIKNIPSWMCIDDTSEL